VHIQTHINIHTYACNTIQYNTISFNGTKKTPDDTDATEDYTKKLNNIAYWKRQGYEYFLSFL